MNSSALTCFCNCSNWALTVFGEPITLHAVMLFAMDKMCGGIRLSMSGTGGFMPERSPVTTFRKNCKLVVAKSFASLSVSATMAFSPTMTLGLSSTSDGLNSLR